MKFWKLDHKYYMWIWLTFLAASYPVCAQSSAPNLHRESNTASLICDTVTQFIMVITVRNTDSLHGSKSQTLTFGIADGATSGYEPNNPGQLDANYCEFELPPLPPKDVFDARWIIPKRNGILRNIVPPHSSSDTMPIVWRGRFQPGFNEYFKSNSPVVITWSTSAAQGNHIKLQLFDTAAKIFEFDMQHPAAEENPDPRARAVSLITNNDSATLAIGEGANVGELRVTASAISGIESPQRSLVGFTLGDAVPNPFSTSANIYFSLARQMQARLEIFTVDGEHVRTLTDKLENAGVHSITWDGCDDAAKPVAAGVYIVQLAANNSVINKKLVLVR
jgi:hypothetical protein